ncbi:hypothetical protein J6590_003822 [Homalodisca vitripennis]|nr:hypothetical protein J6590_003822 [Homalodisca vitripennis]
MFAVYSVLPSPLPHLSLSLMWTTVQPSVWDSSQCLSVCLYVCSRTGISCEAGCGVCRAEEPTSAPNPRPVRGRNGFVSSFACDQRKKNRTCDHTARPQTRL